MAQGESMGTLNVGTMTKEARVAGYDPEEEGSVSSGEQLEGSEGSKAVFSWCGWLEKWSGSYLQGQSER